MTTMLEVQIDQAGYEEAMKTIEQIHFYVQSGETVGLIGPNGAGKSTTIKAILGMLKKFEGKVTFGGSKTYSYIPEHPVFYEEFTLWEHLEIAALMQNLPEQEFGQKAKALIERFKLTHVMYERPDSFSKGMQQKLMICLALLTQPNLYIVDEPFIGLDPIAMKNLLQCFEEEKNRGAGILLCTHVLDTAEKICDRFILLEEGTILAQGKLDDIRQQAGSLTGSLMDCFYQLIEGV